MFEILKINLYLQQVTPRTLPGDPVRPVLTSFLSPLPRSEGSVTVIGVSKNLIPGRIAAKIYLLLKNLNLRIFWTHLGHKFVCLFLRSPLNAGDKGFQFCVKSLHVLSITCLDSTKKYT